MPSNDDATERRRVPAVEPPAADLESVDPDTFRAVAKHALAAGVILLVLALLAVLPGLDRTVPDTPLSWFALVVGVGTLLLVRVVVGAAGSVENLVRESLAGPVELRVTAGVVVKHLVVLAAVLVAYRGLAGFFVPLLAPSDSVWLYDTAFLALALVPTGFVAYYLYGALDPSAAHLTRRVVGADGDSDEEAGATAEPDETAAE